ncbi:DUF2306 domain-containing protein [Mycobacterium sp. UM_CSW]|uniref:DUF2306 domain-containing protein n=1 Tax=Mycobacterium sp. UM_CSW TaxID=1370119 RepID=UPI00082AC38B|nr:DUF2306 domain-containing protein [Mycobacterium sp. UM_CSW]
MSYAKSATGLAVVVVAFLAYSLPPYFTGATRVPATFALHYPLLVGHVMFAAAAMVAAVVQIWPGLRARRPALHRRMGRIYVAAAIPAAVCAMAIGAATPFGPFLAASNIFLASLWLWYTMNGYQAARQRRFADHRRHMVSSATLALSVITNRIWTPILFITLLPLRDSVFGGNAQHYLWFVAGLGAWLGWTIPFLCVRRWLRRTPLTPSTIPQPTHTSRV